MTATTAAGADAARIGKKKGWMVAILEDRRAPEARFLGNLEEVVHEVDLLAVDIPIGLPGMPGVELDDQGRRCSDVQARRLLGRRSNTVFPAPPREALEHESYAAARKEFPSLTAQAFCLGPKILHAAELKSRFPAKVVEFHPEVSFRALQGEALQFPKSSWNGVAERRACLSAQGLVLPEFLENAAGEVPVADVLDAFVGALTAQAVLRGWAQALGAAGSSPPFTRPGVIWTPEPTDG